MKKIFILFFAIFSMSSFGIEAEFSADWNAGQQFYNNGDYRNAIITYNRILTSGVKSAPLYYNLAGAYFKSDELGLAVLNYERALVVDPSMEDAAYNLGVTKAKAIDRIEILPTFFLVSWVEGFGAIASSNTWAIMSIIFLVIAALGAMAWRLKDGAMRRAGFVSLIVGALLAIGSFLYSAAAYNTMSDNNRGVIIAAQATMRTEPNGAEAFKLHSGTTFEFIEKGEAYSQIRLTDGRVAWIANNEIDAITPL